MIIDYLQGKRKASISKKLKRENYIFDCNNVISSMFRWEVPDSINSDMIEPIYIAEGITAWGKVGDELKVYPATLSGEVDDYGLGTNLVGTSLNGDKTFNWTRGVDGVLGLNNSTGTSDLMNIEEFSSMFTEADISLNACVKRSRLTPIALASNDLEKASFESALKKSEEGETSIVMSDGKLNKWTEEGILREKIMQLNDPNTASQLQQIAKHYDDIMRRFYIKYGHAMQSTGKLAQQSVEEIQGYDSIASINPLDRYYHRKKTCDEIKSVLGFDVYVRFSPAWERELSGIIGEWDDVEKTYKKPVYSQLDGEPDGELNNELVEDMEGSEE